MGMSLYAYGEEFWQPALHVGRAFVYESRGIAEALRLKSGVSEITADEAIVEPETLREFIQALLDYIPRNRHPLMLPMLAGYTAVAIMVLRQAAKRPEFVTVDVPAVQAALDAIDEIDEANRLKQAPNSINRSKYGKRW